MIANPSGEGRIADDGGALLRNVKVWREEFERRVEACPQLVVEYATTVVTTLNAAELRISPRRARLLARSLLAATIVTGETGAALFRLVLTCSLPHIAWGAPPSSEKVEAAHRIAWDVARVASDRWVHAFLADRTLERKLEILLDGCQSNDSGSQAIAQLIASESCERAAAFAFSIFPAAALGKLPIGAEGVNDLAKIAAPILKVDGTVSWQERRAESGTRHPEFDRFAKVLERTELAGGRQERAKQFFSWCLVAGVSPSDPAKLEAEMNGCIDVLRKGGLV